MPFLEIVLEYDEEVFGSEYFWNYTSRTFIG